MRVDVHYCAHVNACGPRVGASTRYEADVNTPEPQPEKSLAPDAPVIEAQLLKSSPRYLLALYCQPSSERRRGLEDAADWFGLDSALRRLDPSGNLHTAIDDRWLMLLELCVAHLPSEADRRELKALIEAMRRMRALADDDPQQANLEKLWMAMSDTLRAKAGPTGAGKYDGLNAATLRGRKWHALRAEVARALADVVAHVSPVSLLPRAPRRPSAFHPSTFRDLSRELRREARGSGLVVLTGAQGSGRTELALTYAHEKHEDRSYDQVFVLRASDQLRLERDFLTMARILAPGAEHRAKLRREALRHLETNSRWLIVFMSVNDPVILLPFLPWTTSGHVLCTFDARAVPGPAAEELWLRHFNVVPINLRTLGATLELQTTVKALAQSDSVPRTLRSDPRLKQIARRVDDSRYAMALALGWLQHTALAADSDPSLVAAHASEQLDGYLAQWDRALALLRAAKAKAGPRSHPPGVTAALVLLMELYDPEFSGAKPKHAWESIGWRRRDCVENRRLEHDALLLLARIEPFIDEGLTASTLQVVLLDDKTYETPDRIEDERLQLLDGLALAERATRVQAGKYFDVNAAVLTAVRVLDSHVTLERRALAIASRTMVKVLPDSIVDGALPDLAFEMLPHVEALAHREAGAAREYNPGKAKAAGAGPMRPIVAIELYARAALCHLTRGRTRTAGTRIAEMMRVFDYLAAASDTSIEDWEGIEEDGVALPLPPAARMARLVRALRTSGFPQPAATMCGRLDQVAIEHRAFADAPADVARLRFEGAMALHDLNRIDEARVKLEAAKGAWRKLGDTRRHAMAVSFEAELDFDSGLFRDAREKAERAREVRERLLAVAPQDGLARPAAEIARSNFLLGRIAYVEGELNLARELLGRAVEGGRMRWSAPHMSPRDRASARSTSSPRVPTMRSCSPCSATSGPPSTRPRACASS